MGYDGNAATTAKSGGYDGTIAAESEVPDTLVDEYGDMTGFDEVDWDEIERKGAPEKPAEAATTSSTTTLVPQTVDQNNPAPINLQPNTGNPTNPSNPYKRTSASVVNPYVKKPKQVN